MKLAGHGNGVALTLAGLAVVLAASGTAYAVTASTVRISDSKTSNLARVDSSGRLLTANTPRAVQTIASSGLLNRYQGQDNFVTSPTTATLAITKLSLSESNANTPPSNATELRVLLYKVGVDAAGACASTGYVQLGFYQLSAGDDIDSTFAQPLIVGPTAGKKYCLNLYAYQVSGSAGLTYFPSFQLYAYAVSGTYAGVGVNAKAAARPKGNTGRDQK